MSRLGPSKASSSPIETNDRSLLSRLTSPLRARTKNLDDFHIRPFEPHRQYSPGDVVKGLVSLTVVKPIRITHLTVALHGFVRVFKTPSGAADIAGREPPLTPGSNSIESKYFGNGHASLFQDEVTLCGEGRLEVGVYEFEFELEFPAKGLPTSIDFERGSISYMIRSTLTRPTTIAATSSCDRKLSLVETIDIGPMIAPKSRTISLEPIAKRTRKSTKSTPKTKPKLDKDAPEPWNVIDGTSPTNSPVPDESASQRASAEFPRAPRSPVTSDFQSETSAESVISSSTGPSLGMGTVNASVKSPRDSQGGLSNSSVANKTITATIDLLKGGCLPGDNIPLRISIQHRKRVSSPHGIIITLYRQGRIDSAPPLSLFTDFKGKAAERFKHEEYYPKSKTGLGGLSLTSAGSSSVFRKDLGQTFAPIIIDPSTLSTIVNTSVRVPEDVFPTITSVPGHMISFRYHIEVVVDLGGKLAGQDKHLPRLGVVNIPTSFNSDGHQLNARDGQNPSMLAAWGGSIVDTDHIRREKSVVACLFEIIVGTTDSTRQRGRGNTMARANSDNQTLPLPQSSTSIHRLSQGRRGPHDYFLEEVTTEPNDSRGDQEHPSQESHSWEMRPGYRPRGNVNGAMHHSEQHAPAFVPTPDFAPEEALGEKELIRRAEERLLPSQPPQEGGPSAPHAPIPSAPEGLDSPLYTGGEGSSNLTLGVTSLAPERRAFDQTSSMVPSAPGLEDMTPQATNNPTDDKQELELRRLQAEASSPPDFPDEQDTAGGRSSRTQNEPSAPTIAEEDRYATDYASAGARQDILPRYER